MPSAGPIDSVPHVIRGAYKARVDGENMFTLLHISDLHRSTKDPIENEPLLGALLADRDRYLVETPVVRTPDAAIVSGDIIQGVTLNAPDFAAELNRQYAVAHDFLVRLADRFFDGDRRRVVLVPGNHDVCWNTALAAMKELVPEDPQVKASSALFRASSNMRWNWKSRTIFRIDDSALYRGRLDAYRDFVERFYDGVGLKYPIDRDRGFNLFELDNGRIIVAALESVHGNDCFCRHGAIEQNVLAKCALAIRDLKQQPILRVATWHHSFQGPPHGDDYMDIASVHEMVGNGFRLGLHGHQHQAEAGAHAIHLPEKLSMAISSAGSLCAGQEELPRGVNREYNLVVVNDDYTSARVHVREMTQGNHFGRCGRGPFRVDGFVDLSWDLPVSAAGGAPVSRKRFAAEAVLNAEEALHSGRTADAMRLLEEVEEPLEGHARQLYLEAARELGQFDRLIRLLHEPKTVAEYIELFGAYIAAKEFDAAAALLERAKGFDIDAGTLDGLQIKLHMRKFSGK
jgi:Calcineurin-like phosphoesterase